MEFSFVTMNLLEIFVVFCAIRACDARAVFSEEPEAQTVTVYTVKQNQHSTRFKRGTKQAVRPKHLKFKVHLQNKDIELDMDMNEDLPRLPDLYARDDNDNIEKLKCIDTNDYGFYLNTQQGLAMMVHFKDKKAGVMTITGVFHVDGHAYQIRPDGNATEVNETQTHEVKRIPHAEPGAFQHDTLQLPDDIAKSLHRESVTTTRLLNLLNARVRRNVQSKVLQVVAFPDKSLWDHFHNEVNKDKEEAKLLIALHFAHVQNEMNMRYISLREQVSSLDLRVHISSVYLPLKKKDQWTESHVTKKGHLLGYDALDSFEKWIKSNVNKLPYFNHAMAATKRDLASTKKDASLLGIAYEGSACLSSSKYARYMISLNQNNGDMDDSTFAHEVAHALGSSHDNPKSRSCPVQETTYLMAPIATPSWRFSKCSAMEIYSYIIGNEDCLSRTDFSATVDALAGNERTMDYLCAYKYGPNSRSCQRQRIDSLVCSDGYFFCEINGECSEDWIANTLTGTTCGKNKHCIREDCVTIPGTETTQATTIETTVATTNANTTDNTSLAANTAAGESNTTVPPTTKAITTIAATTKTTEPQTTTKATTTMEATTKATEPPTTIVTTVTAKAAPPPTTTKSPIKCRKYKGGKCCKKRTCCDKSYTDACCKGKKFKCKDKYKPK